MVGQDDWKQNHRQRHPVYHRNKGEMCIRDRENGIRVIGCDVYPREWIADAGNVEVFYQVPYATDTDHYIGTMMSVCRKEGAEAVIPLTDAEIDVFNLQRDEFSGITVPSICFSR